MKKWVCSICGYEHNDSLPPEKCPICSIGPEKFTAVEANFPSEIATKKSWKCTVCDYVHEGNEPPDTCPLCAASKGLFVLLESENRQITTKAVYETTESTTRAAIDKISYGLYILTSVKDNKINGQCCNTVFQLTDQPLQLAVCLNKNNLTYEYVKESGVLAITVLEQSDFAMVRNFGYRSGRTVDKFADIEYVTGANGCPILKNAVAYLEGTVLQEKIVDVGTHSLFVINVTAGISNSDQKPLTYSYFRANKSKF